MKLQLSCETRLDEYTSFLDDKFPKALEAECGDNAELRRLVLDLLLNWRAASYAGAMPSILLRHLEEFYNSYMTATDAEDSALRFATEITNRVCQRVERISTDPYIQRAIRAELRDAAMEVQDAKKQVEGALLFPTQKYWDKYLQEPAFQQTLWATPRIVFVSVYNAYEDFLVHATKLALNLDRLRVTDKEFARRLREAYGDDVTELAWTDPKLHLYRLVRHSLSHAGGKITSNLKGQPLPVDVDDNERLQVYPQYIRDLYSLLQSPLTAICQSACFH